MFDSCPTFTPESAVKPVVKKEYFLVNDQKGEKKIRLLVGHRGGKKVIAIEPGLRHFHVCLSRAIVALPRENEDGPWPIKEKLVGVQVRHSGTRRHTTNGINFDLFRVFLHHEVDEYLAEKRKVREIGYKLRASGGHKFLILFFRKPEKN